ncbi:penicillin-binding protein, partial [Corynebacterium bovis]
MSNGRTPSANHSRSGQTPVKPRRRTRKKTPLWRRLLTIGTSVIAVLIIVPLVAFFAAYAVTKVPEPEELVTNQISHIYASDSNTELARIVPPEGNRQNVDLDQVPMPVRQAVLAAEDRDFYSNPGFSVTGYARAAVGQILGREGAGGGSTITQQYVKNAVVGNESSLTRKAKELVVSAKMAREWSKDDILEAYLNTIYFGRNAYGIGAAAKAYFGKPIEQLTPEEGAVLASSIQRPSALDPWTNRPAAEERWNYVMDGMVTEGAIDRQHRETAVYPQVIDPSTVDDGSVAEGTNGLIKSQVLSELSAAGISETAVNTGGLKITTTIDPKAQAAAVDQVHSRMEGEPDSVRSAVVSVDPKSGGIRAYYGGDDPNGYDFANAGLQTGSTFKIFALAAAIDQGISPYATYDSSPVTTGGTTVNNVEGESCGNCSLAEALKRSLNTSFIRLTRDLKGGPQDVADMAHRLGVAEELPGIGKTLTEPDAPPFEGITLGMYQSRPLDMASALATLSDSGMFHPAHFVEKVETSDGQVLLDNSDIKGTQVIDPDVADSVTQTMAPIAAYSRGHSLAGGRPSAAKTGTAQLGNSGQNKDAWMIGSTPQLATAVWVGDINNQPLFYNGTSMYGSSLPSDIWKSVMDTALEGQDVEYFGQEGGSSSSSGGSSSGSGSSSGGSSSGTGSSSGGSSSGTGSSSGGGTSSGTGGGTADTGGGAGTGVGAGTDDGGAGAGTPGGAGGTGGGGTG